MSPKSAKVQYKWVRYGRSRRSKKYGIQPMPPSDNATVTSGNLLITGEKMRSAAACTMFIGCSVIITSTGASGAVITSFDDEPMCMLTIVPSSLHACQNGSQCSVCKLGSPSGTGFSGNVIAWQPLPATRRTSAASASGSQIGGIASGMKRSGAAPHHSSMCQSLYAWLSASAASLSSRFANKRPAKPGSDGKLSDPSMPLADMSSNGMLGSLNFPSLPGFAGRLFANLDDKDAALALNQAYNDWHIEEWCGAAPDRFIPLAIPPIWDPDALAAEVRRVAKKGCHAITFPENPVPLGLPSLHTDHWDPFWTACSDVGTIVNMHIGSSSKLVITSMDAPVDVMITLQPMNIVQAAADLIFSPVISKF